MTLSFPAVSRAEFFVHGGGHKNRDTAKDIEQAGLEDAVELGKRVGTVDAPKGVVLTGYGGYGERRQEIADAGRLGSVAPDVVGFFSGAKKITSVDGGHQTPIPVQTDDAGIA